MRNSLTTLKTPISITAFRRKYQSLTVILLKIFKIVDVLIYRSICFDIVCETTSSTLRKIFSGVRAPDELYNCTTPCNCLSASHPSDFMPCAYFSWPHWRADSFDLCQIVFLWECVEIYGLDVVCAEICQHLRKWHTPTYSWLNCLCGRTVSMQGSNAGPLRWVLFPCRGKNWKTTLLLVDFYCSL